MIGFRTLIGVVVVSLAGCAGAPEPAQQQQQQQPASVSVVGCRAGGLHGRRQRMHDPAR